MSTRQHRYFGFGLASVLVHAAVIGGLVTVVTAPLAPAPPDETRVELVFEQPAPLSEGQPEPSPPAAEMPPEQVPPPPEAAPREPEPSPPKPELAPTTESAPPPPPEREPALPAPPEPPPPEPEPAPPPPPEPAPVRVPTPRPKPPPLKRAPPRPVAEAPVAKLAPRAEPAPQGPVAPPVAPVAAVVDARWTAAVSGWLAARKTYPEEARRRGEEGRVSVRFTVDRSGRVVEAAIVAASGSALLDEAALRLLRQAVLPAFPADMTQARVTITTTVRYSLR